MEITILPRPSTRSILPIPYLLEPIILMSAITKPKWLNFIARPTSPRTNSSNEAYSNMCIPLAAPEGERYIIGKLSLINNVSPRSEMGGTIRTDDEIFTFYHFHQPKESVAQWISRVPSSFQDVKFYFRSARHLSHNLYNMVPDFVGFL